MEDLAIRIRLEGIEQAQAQARQLVDGLAAATAAFAAFSAGIAAFGGLRFADEVLALHIQFEALTGSAQEAAQIMGEIQRIAQSSQFDTNEVARFAAILRSAGVAGKELSEQIEAVLNLSAALGVRRADFERFAFNLLQIRSGAGRMADIREMLRVAPGIATLLARSLGRERLSVDEISQLLQREGGERFFARIIQLGQQFPGQAARVTPLAALANFIELIQFQMLPTSLLFAKGLQRLIDILSPIVRGFGWLNRLLGGLPGAILALAAASVGAAAALRTLSVVGILASIKDIWRLLIAAPGLLLGQLRGWGALLRGLPALLAPRMGRLSALLGGAFRQLPALLPLLIGRLPALLGGALRQLPALLARWPIRLAIAPLILSALGDWIGGLWGRIISGIGFGAGLGGLIGGIIPGLGSALGMAIGGLLGGLWEPLRRLLAPAPARTNEAEQRIARNTEQMARSLEAIRIQMVGGGEAAASFRTRLEAELAIRKALEGGIA